MYTRHLANEFGSAGIRVNCIAPGPILTERNAAVMSEETQKLVAAMHPLGRIGTPRDVANAAAFLSSDASSWITGITLDVAGGRVML
jgi:3-oxoacyl-[acyl-carrier protein] reductase